MGWSFPAAAEKRPLVQKTAAYQTVEIYGSPKDNNTNHNTNKRVFLDGVLQSTLHGLEPYHESLVHAALVASRVPPQRVAIIGGGEGATLREVLKHASVETCVMVKLDQELVELAEQHLPEWNNCHEIPGANDDERRRLLCIVF